MKSLIGFGLVIAIIALPYSCFGQYRTFVTKKGTFSNACLESTSLRMGVADNGKYHVIGINKKGEFVKYATVSYFDLASKDQNIFMFRKFTYKGRQYVGMLVKATRFALVFLVLNRAPAPDPVYRTDAILTIPTSKYKICAEQLGYRYNKQNFSKKEGGSSSPLRQPTGGVVYEKVELPTDSFQPLP